MPTQLVTPVMLPAGTAAAPALQFIGAKSGFFRTGSSIGLSIKGTEVVRWASTGAITVTSAAAAAFAVGLAGATNPAFSVDASTASSATGVKVTSAAAAARAAISVTSSGTDEGLDIDAKGTGTIRLGNTSTGNIVLSRAATGVSLSTTAGYTAHSATAVPATAGAVAAGTPIVLYSTALVIEATSNTPTHSRPKGSICINTGGSSTTTRMYVNTDGAGTWTPFTTSA